ncbi:Pkinase-domain-containing protein [Xylariaceae sp. FL0662B]|nr:Pkinase-domain-containing protein [Xylariaceae sp. FL0662B]
MQSASQTVTAPTAAPGGAENVGIRPSTPTLESSHGMPPPSPQIAIEQVGDAPGRPSLAPHLSAPPAAPHFPSPMRHHKRTPSQHREVKETLNARTDFTNDETDGRSQQTINQYTLREEIGRGSYGAVHLATDQFGKEYAVKEFSKLRLRKRAQSNVLRRPEGGVPRQLAPGRGQWSAHRKQLSHHEIAEAKDALYLIREEIAIMKKLNHPNLVALIEVLDDPEQDSLYMVLEVCKKGVVMRVSLDEQADPYDDERCRHWFRDLILGIEYLHAQGIIHRDIKPDNLLLTEDDVLKIVDFGVSEIFEKTDQMMTKKSTGSPAFLPPELCQARHDDISGTAADVWSMGVSLYCLKYGRLPFQRANMMEMYEAIRTEDFYLPRDEDENFVDLITRILDKNSKTRITLREIRNHPWVTKGGIDSLLSEEENCSDVIEPPNELEVNHAFTRKMDHLLCVLRAIQRFKSLISSSRATTPEVRTPGTPQVPEDKAVTSTPTTESQTPPRPHHKSIAEEAAELVQQRRAYLASQNHPLRQSQSSPAGGERGHAHDPTDKAPLLLGIGTGGRDDFVTPEPPADVVSDSPTGIDFDVYDEAFATEIKRIRSDKKKERAKTYLTRLVGEQEVDKYRSDDCMVLEAGKSLASSTYSRGSSALSRGLSHMYEASGSSHQEGQWRGKLNDTQQEGQEGVKKAVEVTREKGHKFANLVASMTKDLKEKNLS